MSEVETPATLAPILDRDKKTAAGRFVGVAEVAAWVGLPKSTIYDLARENRIGGIVRFGRRLLFDVDELERWIKSGGEALPGGWRKEPT